MLSGKAIPQIEATQAKVPKRAEASAPLRVRTSRDPKLVLGLGPRRGSGSRRLRETVPQALPSLISEEPLNQP
jgi:hypothetical protein